MNAATLERNLSAERNPIDPVGLQFVRASGLAQARLQLAILSGNRSRALLEIDRLVEIDRRIAQLIDDPEDNCGEISGENLDTHLARQRSAIVSEKLALGAAVEFPRVPVARGDGDELLLGEEQEIAVIEHAGFGRKLTITLFWLVGAIVAVSLLAIAVPILAAGWI